MSQLASTLHQVSSTVGYANSICTNVQALVDRLLNCTSTLSGHPAIVIAQPHLLEQKLNCLLDRGIRTLQVVSDFDHTLSKFRHNSKQVPITHGIFYGSSRLPPSIEQRWKDTLDFYLPIERDLDMPCVKKLPLMVDFWNSAHSLLIEAKLHRSFFDSVTQQSGIILRDQANLFLRLLREYSIPLLIFSAGIGDVIEALLKQADLYSDHLRVVSNFMEFDSEGQLTRFRDPLVHIMNKTMRIIPEGEDCCNFTDTSTLLLLGDTLADANMVAEHDVPSAATVKIGFLNDPNEKSLARFKSVFDIVLIEDETFRVPLMILEFLLSSTSLEPTRNYASS